MTNFLRALGNAANIASGAVSGMREDRQAALRRRLAEEESARENRRMELAEQAARASEQRDVREALADGWTLDRPAVSTGSPLDAAFEQANAQRQRATIGGRTYLAPLENNRAFQERIAREKAMAPPDPKFGEVTVDGEVWTTKNGEKYQRMGRAPVSARDSDDSQRRADELAEAEAWWNSPQGAQGSQEAYAIYKRLSAQNPARSSREIIGAIYNAHNKRIQNERTTGLTNATNAKGAPSQNPFLTEGAGATGGAPPAPAAPPAASMGVDATLYRDDPEYRAWVDRNRTP